MKFAWRIFILCIGVYILSLTVTGIIVTENTYNSLLNKEIERSIDEADNLYSTLTLYLINNMRVSGREIELKDYSQGIVDMFETENSYLEIFDENLNLLASNTTQAWFLPRKELEAALQGQKNFILRRDDTGAHYLFISDMLRIDEEKMVLSFIKDISHIDEQRKEQYLFFFRVGIIGLFFVALIAWFISKFVIKPIKELSLTARSIASGNYKERAKVTGSDEVGLLAEQFNIMASEIERRISQLENESERKQRFIDNLTHELRTPLTSIIGYAEVLQKIDYDPEIFYKSLNYIQAEGSRMLKLANTLMDVILLREKALQLEKHNVLPILQEIKEIMKVKAEEKGLSIKVQGEETRLLLDKDLFKGAIINLVDNSINASEQGTIVLGIEKDQDKVAVFVQDEGKGMEDWERKRVREPFYRIEKSRSRKEGGLGLGLAITHQIVEGHGAELEIESQPGQGTKVSIVFNKSDLVSP
ncbi:MAG: HAMP domain-containing histidine kinase [Clostridia bacterium]|nr:HAMP domain-containing histidine kinase [Clostridia bacterium]